jgi:pimeloyl-ACP methyl ester carboxylesterase
VPYATNDGCRIHYEVEGSGPPLVLLHVFTRDLRDLRATGLVDALRDRFQLILMDARGHGRSGAPHNPTAYARPTLARDVVSVLDALAIERAHFLGYSMGGGIGFGIAKHTPGRFASLIIGGAHPYRGDPAQYTREASLLEQGIEAYVGAWESAGIVFTPDERRTMLACDPLALRAMRLARRDDAPLDDALPDIALPCLLYAGDNDEPEHELAQRAAQTMSNATFVSLPGMDHMDVYHQGDIIAPHVVAFLQEISA